MDYNSIINKLRSLENPYNIKGMARFGINSKNTLGISTVELKKISKEIGKNHELGIELWNSGIHEAKILASFISEPKLLTREQMEKWAKDFDSWDVCDQVCNKLFDKAPNVFELAYEWMDREEEFVRRAGFVLIATLAVHEQKVDNSIFEKYFDKILNHCTDERNYVKKAVNWAIRQLGKRDNQMHGLMIILCNRILNEYSESGVARWIARDALRELSNPKTIERINNRKK